MSIMRRIRKNKKAARIPLIILIVALSAGMVGTFAMGSIPSVNLSGTAQVPFPGDQASRDQGTTGQAQSSSQEARLRVEARDLEQALKPQPNNKDLLIKLGNVYYDLGVELQNQGRPDEGKVQFRQAVETYAGALEIEPSNVNVRVDMATAAFYSAENDRARQDFQQAVKDDPKHMAARRNYGIFLMQVDRDYAGAVKQWEEALALRPDDTQKRQLNDMIKQARDLEATQSQTDNK